MRRRASQRGTSQHVRTARDLAQLDQGTFAPLEIREAREVTERQLYDRLQKAGSFLNVEKVMALVFECDASGARIFLSAMLTAFDCDVPTADKELLYLIQDAWDYFPHRFLQGRCPAELSAYLFEDQLGAA
jgi:hypothetical protein